VAATPFDVVKTRQQADPERYAHGVTGMPLGIVATGARIAKEEGPGMLLCGIGPTCIGYLVQGAVKYGLWEVFKASLGFSTARGCGKVGILILAAFGAEIFASLVLYPFERARIRLVSDPSFSKGLIPALLKMVREEGPWAMLTGDGLAATLVKQTAYTVSKLTVFVLVFELIVDLMHVPMPRMAVTFLSSVVAGLFAGIASQPGDTLQVCTSTDSSLRESCPVDVETGAPPSMMRLARMLGWQALFTGWRTRILQVEVIVVIQLLIYDGIKHAVGI